MRRPAARGATLSVAAGVLAFAALFLSNGSSQSRLFWIGGAAVLVAAAGWALQPPRLGVEGLLFFGALGGFAVWQGVSISWSIQPARSWDYANRGLAYFAFAAVGALLGGVPVRRLGEAAAVLLGALFVWALAAKVVPGIYGDYGRLARLRYPLGYWNELALLGAASTPLGLWLAGQRAFDRRVRVGGTLLLYLALVVVVLTYSRVGIVLSVAAALVWLALDRERLLAIGPLAVAWVVAAAVAGAGLLLPGVSKDGESHGTRVQDGLAFGLAVVVGAGVLVIVSRRLSARAVDPRLVRGVAAVLVAVVLAAFAASVVRAGGPAGFVRDRWHEFSNPVSSQVSNTPGRFASTSSSNRWRWWQEAWHAFTDRPLEGTGAGTFALTDRLQRRSTLAVVEPHSLPLQDLSETGIVGLLLAAGIVAGGVLVFLRRERSAAVAALGLAAGVCVVHALVDIDWDYVAVQGPLLLVVGALAARPPAPAGRPRWLLAGAVAVAALAGLYSLSSPWLAGQRLNAAYDAIGRLDAADARSEAKAAHSFNPLAVEPLWVWAATETGERALDLYRQARDREPKNPETWYELGAYEYDLGRYRAAYRDLNQSYTLDRYGPAGVKGGLLDQARCKVDPATCPK
jgi:O-antigen ligase/polysaccharide polymerase Wzy-like membrane protein